MPPSAGTAWRAWARQFLIAAVPFVVFWFALLCVALPSGLSTTLTTADLPVLSYSREAALEFGASDAGSLLTAAISLRDTHAIVDAQRWVYNLWPPGMIVVDLVLLQLEAVSGIPIVLLMVITTTLVIAIFLTVAFAVIKRVSLPVALAFGVGSLLYTGVSVWTLDTGLFYSDSFGVIGFCFSLLFLVLMGRASSRRGRFVWAVLAGVALAAGAYFRASFELVADASLGVAVVVLGVVLVARWRGWWGAFPGRGVAAMVPLVVMGVVAQLVMLPWRLYGGLRNHPGDFRWSAVSDLASVARWLPESVLRERGIFFAIDGHSNWACLGDPGQCERIYVLEQTAQNPYGGSNGGYFTGAQFDAMTLNSFLTHPFNFIVERIDALSLGFVSNTGASVRTWAIPESLVIAALFVVIVVVMFRRRLWGDPAYLFFLLATGAQLATLTLLHMEARYFLGIEMGIIVMGALAVATLTTRHREPDTTTTDDVPELVSRS